jgi:hypothetical protein
MHGSPGSASRLQTFVLACDLAYFPIKRRVLCPMISKGFLGEPGNNDLPWRWQRVGSRQPTSANCPVFGDQSDSSPEAGGRSAFVFCRLVRTEGIEHALQVAGKGAFNDHLFASQKKGDVLYPGVTQHGPGNVR